jgi:probable phosphoglycerate mutase
LIYIVRHGETIWNLEERRQGRDDSPLTETGIEQAKSLGLRLRNEFNDENSVQIVSSPLGRAKSTALIIAKHLCINESDVSAEPLLTELDVGTWEGMTNEQVDEMFPGERKHRNRNRWEYVYPCGESYEALFNRSMRWLAKIPEDSVVIAVTHEMISRTIRGAYCKLTPESILKLRHPHNVVYRLFGGVTDKELCA